MPELNHFGRLMPSLTMPAETGEKPSEMTAESATGESGRNFDLERFVDAQAAVYSQALGELRAGEKRSHWMWFIFPQIKGLGASAMAQRYAIRSREEAEAYLKHPVLGARLRECVETVNGLKGRRLDRIFGYPDDRKFHSCVTLFAACSTAGGDVFRKALEKYCDATPDSRTLELLG